MTVGNRYSSLFDSSEAPAKALLDSPSAVADVRDWSSYAAALTRTSLPGWMPALRTFRRWLRSKILTTLLAAARYDPVLEGKHHYPGGHDGADQPEIGRQIAEDPAPPAPLAPGVQETKGAEAE